MSKRTPVVPQCFTAFEDYVKETNVSCVELSHLHTPSICNPEDVLLVLKFLPESQVTELSIDGINLSEDMKTFTKYLKATKIKKLSMRLCDLSHSKVMYLLKVLNNTQIVELYLHSSAMEYGTKKARKLVSYLLQSRLTKLSFHSDELGEDGILSFAGGLHKSRLTSLTIQGRSPKYANALASLFPKLPHCQITDLGLNGTRLSDSLIKALSEHLAATNIEKLSLVMNDITDAGLDILAQGMVNSNVTELCLSFNLIHGQNNSGQHFQNSKIRVLGLKRNSIESGQMFASNFLKMCSIEELDLRYCSLGDEVGAEIIRSLRSAKLKKLNLKETKLGRQSIAEFAAVLKDTILEDVVLSQKDLPSERFDLLSGCVKESKLKSIKLNGPIETETTSCFRFLEGIKNSPLRTLKMYVSLFSASDAELFAQALRNSTFTHFGLKLSNLKNVFPTLVLNLKYTSITHLSLKSCHIGDEGVQLLSQHLNETKLMDLDLTDNGITHVGARVLSECCPRTSLIHLNLDRNKIGIEGLELLYKRIANSLITFLRVAAERMYGDDPRVLRIKKALFGNQVRSRKLVHFFERVLLQNGAEHFCFHQCVNNTNIQDFLDECLEFSKSITELPQPAVISTLLDGLSLPMSREKMASLLFDEFPRQFVEFIGTSIEADAWQHVRFLKRAEELGLVKIVECLLLSRPLFMIDEVQQIMHPDVYGLLVKYKQPICNEDIEPGGIERIKAYFTAHSDLEGAEHVVNLLSFNERKAIT